MPDKASYTSNTNTFVDICIFDKWLMTSAQTELKLKENVEL